MSESCPCCSGLSYEKCCKPLLELGLKPKTAEQLMRSRYTAFARGQVDYILTTSHPQHRRDIDLKAIKAWSEQSEWIKLEIIRTEQGLEQDETGMVEFIAHYKQQGHMLQHHEVGRFQKYHHVWHYTEGRTPSIETVRHEQPKVGRNDPCSCGSGKKYKKCCGVAA